MLFIVLSAGNEELKITEFFKNLIESWGKKRYETNNLNITWRVL